MNKDAATPALGTDDVVALTTDADDQWHRVHPVSPLVRGWVAVVAVLFIFGRNSFDSLLSGDWDGESVPGGTPLPVIGVAVGAAVVIFGLSYFLSWRFTRYQVTSDQVRINSGVIFRQQRQARIDRVQAIDVVQPLLARIFGLAELKFEVADGGKSAMRLSFLKAGEAQRLRAAILQRAAGVSVNPDSPHQVYEAPETPVLALPPGRIVAAAFLSETSIAAVIAVIAAVVLVVSTQSPAVLLALVPGVLAFAAAYWKAITTDFNFKVAMSPDGVRLHYGMLETRAQTIPPGRVQAVGISQGFMWRIMGWYRVQVNVAGYGTDTSQGGARSVLLPVGTLNEVMTVLGLVFPDPGTERPFELFTAGLTGKGGAEGFLTSPKSARWLDPWTWRRNGFAATRTALLCRRGVLVRRLDVVPHERTQSLGLRQGPVMAALGLASFELHSTVGPLRPVVQHMDTAIALQLFDEQAARAATARRIHNSDAWRSPVAPPAETPLPQAHKEHEHGR